MNFRVTLSLHTIPTRHEHSLRLVCMHPSRHAGIVFEERKEAKPEITHPRLPQTYAALLPEHPNHKPEPQPLNIEPEPAAKVRAGARGPGSHPGTDGSGRLSAQVCLRGSGDLVSVLISSISVK